MALRSLGSSLMAKASPGGALRKRTEERIQGATQAGAQAGQPGSVQRQSVQEPLEKQVPTGTQKVVSVQPTIQPTVKGAETAPTAGIVPQMGGAGMAGATGRSIASGGGQASPVSPGGGAARVSAQAPTAVSAGAAPGARPATRNAPTPGGGGAVLGLQAPPSPTYSQSGFLGGILPTALSLGGRSMAGGGNESVPQNFGQAVAGAVGNAINTVGRALGNPLPERNVSENLQKFASNVSNTIKGVGSISKPAATVQAVAQKAAPVVQNVVRSVQKAVQQATQKATNVLRSLFRW
ncbi:MAG: hypothetical protein M1445_08495 [Bacteroidetes bacterium]|nr:hypothetical protein [Bacteroidota bacterium]